MRENIDEIDEFLMIHQNFPYKIFLLAIANVMLTTISSIFYSAHKLAILQCHFVSIVWRKNLTNQGWENFDE